MSFLTSKLGQVATLWSITGVDGGGDPTFAAPRTINVRWESRINQNLDSRGEHQRSGTAETSAAFVYLAEDVKEGDYVFLGTSVIANPRSVLNAFRVKAFEKTPSYNSSMFERRAFV